MDRKEFLQKMTLGTGAVIAVACFPGCSNKAGTAESATKGQVSIDLDNPKYKAIIAAGGFIYHKRMIIAHLDDGSYVAVANRCTHAGGRLEYHSNQKWFHCLKHGAKFNTKGEVLKGPAQMNLRVYDVIVEGNKLVINS